VGVQRHHSYYCDDAIATITIDDGKVNALSFAVLAELNAALDQAERDGAVVILAGRDGVFSAGFDLPVLRGGGPDALAMLRAGFELAARLLAFPRPVVIACTGHAVAMGVFLLLCGDYRVGATGPYKITANEARALQPGGGPRRDVRPGRCCCGRVPGPDGPGVQSARGRPRRRRSGCHARPTCP
jgi:enoyl-CoA hydratase/carnithine racemase